MIGVGIFWFFEVLIWNVWFKDWKGGWLVGYFVFNYSVVENIGLFIYILFFFEGDNEDIYKL